MCYCTLLDMWSLVLGNCLYLTDPKAIFTHESVRHGLVIEKCTIFHGNAVNELPFCHNFSGIDVLGSYDEPLAYFELVQESQVTKRDDKAYI